MDIQQPLSPIAASIRLAQWPRCSPASKDTLPGDMASASRQETAAPAVDGKPEVDERKIETQALVKVIGARMREARELAGFSLSEAAKHFGYRNPSKLSKIELATDTDSVPILTILKAATLFDVSIDFLFGVSDDWERDPRVARERQVARWLHDHLEAARARDAAAFVELARKVEAVTTHVQCLADGADQTLAAFERFEDLNASFEDMLGGAKLQATVQRLATAGREARQVLRRLHLDLAGRQIAEEPAHA